MADFEGTWDVDETTFHGSKRTLKDRPVQITIKKNTIDPTQYDVTIPLQGGKFEVFTESPYMAPNGQTISHTWVTPGNGRYGVRLVFDHNVNPAKIVGEEPGDSVIERWRPHMVQPADMGTITGQRVSPLATP
ncbi:MAG: hypothetical protein ACJ76Y_17685 [Thermoanaerobaculia bacterium]